MASLDGASPVVLEGVSSMVDASGGGSLVKAVSEALSLLAVTEPLGDEVPGGMTSMSSQLEPAQDC